MAHGSDNKPLFRDLNADDDDPEQTEIESLCLNCGENGTTRLLMTKIPFYNEIIIMSFHCSHCGHRNNETQFGGRIQEKGIKYRVLIQNKTDLNRQVVKSDYATIIIPQVELEIPPHTRKGEITTVEGIIDNVITGLQQDQELRRKEHAEIADKIETFVNKLEVLKSMKEPFHLVIDDPSGNSFVENPMAPTVDAAMEVTHYNRLHHHNMLLGLISEEEQDDSRYVPENEVAVFETNCYHCNSPCQTNMKPTKIPHFKEVIIMSTNCDVCGHRTNEVKSGAGIESKGVHFKLQLTQTLDLHRDVLKSDTCSVHIPELDLDVGPGAIGGRFTTVEGLLDAIKEQLKTDNPFVHGDSLQPQIKQKMEEFLKRLKNIQSGTVRATVVLDDPAGNSYIQNINYPEPDPNLEETHYERTFEQNEELGLNDMKTEDYEECAD